MSQVRIAVAGAGLIGKRHIEEVDANDSAVLASIVDPGPAGPETAQKYGVPSYPSLAELFAKDKPDGIILATPNQMHVTGGLECVDAGVPVLVEKPIGDTVASATRLVEAGESARVSVLTGHHRNYSPIMTKAREIIESGVLGRLVGVQALPCSTSPTTISTSAVDGDASRGGPILVNLTHEVTTCCR
jgi:predicted dehydrogenase